MESLSSKFEEFEVNVICFSKTLFSVFQNINLIR